MKELEKTKRISIATVLFILVILISLLSYKRPKNLYAINTQSTLENILNTDYLLTLNDLNTSNQALIDIRSKFEFEKGHLENAINIYAPEILNESNINVFDNLKKENNTIVLYGTNPNETLASFMLLNQLGYSNLKILSVKNSYNQNKLITENIEVEKSAPDVNAFIEESIKKAKAKPKPKPVVKKAPKKIIPVKKKKKMPAEGGC